MTWSDLEQCLKGSLLGFARRDMNFDRSESLLRYNKKRYDTIEEFNVDSKAEYSVCIALHRKTTSKGIGERQLS